MVLDRKTFRGIYVIVVTPFTEQLDLDEDALRATLKFCFGAGVHGVVATAIASEAGYLGEAERRRSAEIVVREATAAGVPAVVAVSSASWKLSTALAEHATGIGASAIMATPPTFQPATAGEIRTFYSELTKVSDLPLILQNGFGPSATPMSPALLWEIMQEQPTARFVKEETLHPAQSIGELRRLAGDTLHGVMGGMAGRTLMQEVRHGACGTMPACEFADIHVALWKAIENGPAEEARRIFRHLLPLLDLERTFGMPIAKEVLKMRGVIPTATSRQTGSRPLDAETRAEITVLLDDAAKWMMPDYAHSAAT